MENRMAAKPTWVQEPCTSLSISVDLEALRVRLEKMSDGELLAFGKEMRELVYPLTYDYRGKPNVSAFSIQLEQARAEWRRRHGHEGESLQAL
jgi:hypothetical protein